MCLIFPYLVQLQALPVHAFPSSRFQHQHFYLQFAREKLFTSYNFTCQAQKIKFLPGFHFSVLFGILPVWTQGPASPAQAPLPHVKFKDPSTVLPRKIIYSKLCHKIVNEPFNNMMDYYIMWELFKFQNINTQKYSCPVSIHLHSVFFGAILLDLRWQIVHA